MFLPGQSFDEPEVPVAKVVILHDVDVMAVTETERPREKHGTCGKDDVNVRDPMPPASAAQPSECQLIQRVFRDGRLESISNPCGLGLG